MTGKFVPMTEDLFAYVQDHSALPHPILEMVADVTRRRPDAVMQINRNQGSFMHLLVKAMGARRLVEVGTFTGYSAIAMASALPADGRLHAFDINPETAAIARDFFAKAGLSSRIDLRVGDAKRNLGDFVAEAGEGSVDLAFVDADKTGYAAYYELCLRLLRPGGILLLDNAIYGGEVLSPAEANGNAAALRDLNETVAADARIEACLLPIADGLYMIRKR